MIDLLSCTRFRGQRVTCFTEQEVGHGATAVYAVGNGGGRIRRRHFRPAPSDRAFKFTGRVAGDSIASHADFTNIDALTQLLWIKV